MKKNASPSKAGLVGALSLTLALPLGASLAAPATAAVPKVTYTYDALGRLQTVADATGATKKYTYDAVGNLLTIGSPVFPSAAKKAAAQQDREPTAAVPPGKTEHTVPRNSLASLPKADRGYQPLTAPKGQTAVTGAAKTPDGRPLAGVIYSVGSKQAKTGADGRFLLTGLDPEQTTLTINAHAATGGDYGSYQQPIKLEKGEATALPGVNWLTLVERGKRFSAPAKITGELALSSSDLPNLNLKIPAGTKLTGLDGKPVRSLSLVKIDPSKQPVPPTGGTPMGWTLQPGLASVETTSAGRGTNWDTSSKLFELSTAQAGPGCDTQNQGCAGEPFQEDELRTVDGVNLAYGVLDNLGTDLSVSDVSDAALNRHYHQGDSSYRDFGLAQGNKLNIWAGWNGNGYYQVGFPSGLTVTFTADPDGQYRAKNTPSDLQGAVFGGGYPNGYTITFKDGRVWYFGYYHGYLTAQTDRHGNTLTVERDYYNGRAYKITSPNNRWIQFTYKSCGSGYQCIGQAKDNTSRTVKYDYDPNARLTKFTNAAGKATTYTWNECTDWWTTCNQIASVKNAVNVITDRYTYNGENRLTRRQLADDSDYKFEYVTNPDNLRIVTTTVTDPRGAKRRVTFNASGYPLTDTKAFGTPLAQATTYTRDANTNRVLQLLAPLSRRTTNTYDAKGNLLTTTKATGTSTAQKVTYTYEPMFSRVASIKNALNKTTTFTYDDGLETKTDPLGHTSTTEFSEGFPVRKTDALGNATTVSYLDGKPVAVSDPLERTRTLLWDAAGRLTRTTDATGRRTSTTYNAMDWPTKVTDAAGNATTTAYDAVGNALTRTNPLGQVETSTYDGLNRPLSWTDALGNTENYTYNSGGDLAATVDRKGQTTTQTYDVLGRSLMTGYKATTSGGTTTYESTSSKTWDAGDRLTKLVDSVGGTIDYTYDALDRLSSEAGSVGTVGYTYDLADRRTGMTAPNQAATSYTYDDADRMTSLVRAEQTVAFTWDDADRRTSVTMPGNLKRTLTYDAASQVTKINHSVGTTNKGDLLYTYDDAGRTLTADGSAAKVNLPANWSGAEYNANNQLTQLGAKSLTYDANGQLTNDGTLAYTWNARGQLTQAGASPYTYDAVGRRASKKVGADPLTAFLYDGQNVLQERRGAAVFSSLLAGLGPDEIYTRTTTGNVIRSFMTDRLGSTVSLADPSGTVTVSYTYDPFGKATASGSSNNSFYFTGLQSDGNGLQYNRSRYHNFALQRYINESVGYPNEGSNRYTYAGSDPVNNTDPTGTGSVRRP
ncbi:hypothetical protein GCM10027456_20790 [Kineosporia babensis]